RIMKRALTFLTGIYLLISPYTSSFAQANYYVAPDGDDLNTGLTDTQAFSTITHAATIAMHGDTIWVLPGIYTNSTYQAGLDIWKNERTVDINNKTTTTANYLTIKPQTPNSVTLKGDGSFVFQIRNSNYIRIEGFQIVGEADNIPMSLAMQYQFTYKDSTGAILERIPPGTDVDDYGSLDLQVLKKISRPSYFNTSGISVNSSHHIEIVNNAVSKMPGEGIRSFKSDFLTIIRNTVSFCSGRSSTGVHGLSVYTLDSEIDPDNANFEGQRVLIAQNKVFQNFNELISWSEKKNTINAHIDEGKGITIQRCTEDYDWHKGIIRIENNIAYRNGFSGIQINSGTRVEILHNTCYENNYTSAIEGVGDQHGISVQDGNTILIANNIVQSDSTISNGKALKISNNSGQEGSIVVSDNLILGKMNGKAAGFAIQTQTFDPMFADTAGRDFTLLSGSPAIDAANPIYSVSHDFGSNARDGLPDFGAIEFIPATSIETLNSFSTNVFPNPARDVLHFTLETLREVEIEYALLSLEGRLLIPPVSGSSKQTHILDLSTISNGMYILHILAGPSGIVRRIVVQR
ncbi:MAG: T9SS type A sorting domain-containing protein, partial [Bacteroidota bacterium]